MDLYVLLQTEQRQIKGLLILNSIFDIIISAYGLKFENTKEGIEYGTFTGMA